MKFNYKTAYILMDESDLKDLKDFYQYAGSKETLLVPFDFTAMMQAVFNESNEAYYIPKIIQESEFSFAKGIYSESQKFLRQLLLSNKIVDEKEDSFPLEYPWFCFWVAINRTLSFCSNFINEYSVDEVVLIKRGKLLNHGGLLINTASFTHLVEVFFKDKGFKVKVINDQSTYLSPRTIFYSQPYNFKTTLKHLIKFIYWKVRSFNKKNYEHILINPKYDNVINYHKTFNSKNKVFPQVFHGRQIPFLHSWRKLLSFIVARTFLKYRHSDNNEAIESYKSKLNDFEFDFISFFKQTIVQYSKDLKWMENYVDTFWDNCLDKDKQYLTIFSLSPVHLESYFLIKKTKENSGKAAVWQHGGRYGYSDYFQHYITDYKNTDYFLSFGKPNIKEMAESMKDTCSVPIEVGSNVLYDKTSAFCSKAQRIHDPSGLFIPSVIGRFYGKGSIKWCGDLQTTAIKQIVDFFNSGGRAKLVVKGLKQHRPHQEIQKYINKNHKYVSYTDISLEKAMSANPSFIIFDDSATSFLQVLAQYSGTIFLMVNQKIYPIRQEALGLLKRRVVYSESVGELEMQLAKFFKEGSLAGVDTSDTSFRDVYLKKFRYRQYERFLQEAALMT